jgi:hypothetical protein
LIEKAARMSSANLSYAQPAKNPKNAGAILLALSATILLLSGILFGINAALGTGLVLSQALVAIFLFFDLKNDWAFRRFGNTAFLIGGSCFLIARPNAMFGNWQLVHFGMILLLSALSAIFIVVLGAIVQIYRRKIRANPFQVMVAILSLAIPLAGIELPTLLELNIGFDRSTPHVIRAKTTDKTEYEGRRTDYTVSVSNPALSAVPLEIKVSRDDYLGIQKGDEVCVVLSNGAIGVPWFTRVTCAAKI